jgi:hypothetical protein
MGQAVVILTNSATREQFCRWVMAAPPRTIASLRGVKRTIPQNARLWALLTDVARQATWAGKKRTTEQWKDLFSGAVKAASGGLEAVPGLEGGFMILGLRTSEMTTAEMVELQDYIEAWGAQNGVTFSDPGEGEQQGGGVANNHPAGAAQ